MPGLGTSFGRGGATTAQQDLANADAILIMGSSMAENHPVGFRWVLKARERGATIIHVDPRFSRTSAMADMWLPLRAGSDIVFLGALVNHVLTNGLVFRECTASPIRTRPRSSATTFGIPKIWAGSSPDGIRRPGAIRTSPGPTQPIPARLTNRGATRRCSIHGASFKSFRGISRAIRLPW